MAIRVSVLSAALAAAWLLPAAVGAQAPASAPAAATARELAPIDLTGYWVSVVTEDWRYRMVMPQTGDFGSVPLTAEGRRVASQWKPQQAGRCEAFGVGSGMRAPGRLHIEWESDSTLRIETEAGAQTRHLYLGAPPAAGAPTWQGVSAATWDGPPDVIDVLRTGGFDQLNRGTGQAARRLAWTPLKVTTTSFRAGWLRANGVPYSDSATITEHFMRYTVPGSGEWLTIRTVVDDPVYLVQPFMVSTNFKKVAPPGGSSGAPWAPKACRE
jgi:hypothetical protein